MLWRKIVLFGKTGDGKSSAGNTILRKKVFTTKASANSVTDKCERKYGLVHGRKITVIDTPGFFDTGRDDEKKKSEIIKSLIECAPAVHAFVIVLKVGRYTRQENEVVQQFLNTMKGEHVLKHTVILFTHGDQLEGQTIDEFVKTSPQLQELVDKCGGRRHVIDKKYWKRRKQGNKSNRVQVKNLLETIDEMVKENGCFTTELLKKVEEEIQEEIKKNEDNLSPEEKREEAKKIVCKKFKQKFAGVLTGALIGAALGVVVSVAAVLSVLQSFCSARKLIKAKDIVAGTVETGAAAVGAGAAAAAVGGGAAAVAGGGGAAAAAVGGGAAAVAGGGGAVAVGAGAAAGGGGAAAVGGGAAAVGAGAAAVGAGAAAVGARAAAAAVGAGAATAETGAAAGAGVGAGTYVVGVAALAGAIGGVVTGWKAAEEADSAYEAMTLAVKLNYENATVVVEKITELVALASNNKLEGKKKDI